jgi:hypothetical protein
MSATGSDEYFICKRQNGIVAADVYHLRHRRGVNVSFAGCNNESCPSMRDAFPGFDE